MEAFTLIKFEKKLRINALCKQISSLTEMKLLNPKYALEKFNFSSVQNFVEIKVGKK
jgi:hypothetical protein